MAEPDINDPVTETSLSFSVEEMDQSQTEFVVINTDEGNTFAGKLLKELLTDVKAFRIKVSNFERQLEKHLSLPQTNQREISYLQEIFKHHVEKFEKHCEEAAMASEFIRLSEKHEKLQKEMEALREEYNQNFKNFVVQLETPSSEVPVTETAENEEVSVVTATGSVMELPFPVISDLLLKLDDLALQMIPKEATIKKRSVPLPETHTNEVSVCTAIPKIEESFDKCDSPQLQRTYSASSSGIGSAVDHPTLVRDDNTSKLFNIGKGENTPAADESLPPEIKLCQKISTLAVREGECMTEKDHNYLEVIWAMGDLTNALKRLIK